jgi:hypothetical protein
MENYLQKLNTLRFRLKVPAEGKCPQISDSVQPSSITLKDQKSFIKGAKQNGGEFMN